MDSEDHNEGNEDSVSDEEHQLVDVVTWYSLSSSFILWIHSQFEEKSHMIATNIWALMIGIEYPGCFSKYMIVLNVSTCSTSFGGTTHELNPDEPCELMTKHHSFQEAVTHLDISALFDLQRRKVTHGGQEWMTSVIDGKMDSEKGFLNVSQNHFCFQNSEFAVYAIPLPPRYQESSIQPLPAAFDLAARQVDVVPNSATAVPASDQDGYINDRITHGSGADAVSLVGYMTDPQAVVRSTFEVEGLRFGGCSPISVIAQETDQQATHRYDLRISQNEMPRALYTRGIDNLPAPALPAVISSRSSEGPSQTTGSKFLPRQSPSETGSPSADLCRQGDASQTTDICPNRSTDHHSSACLLKSNATMKEVTPSETGSPSVDDCRLPWDAPGTPGIFYTRKTDHCTQKEVAALKESKAVGPTKNQQKVSANTGTKKGPSPVYPDYTERSTRIASFGKWSPELQQPEEMADCGFYYTGYQDIVRCFACGGHFKNWVPDRNPWMEHARWFPKCPYILQIKGVEFVNSVRRMTEESNEKDGAPLGGVESSNRIDNLDPDNNPTNCTDVIDVAGSKAPLYGAVGGAATSTHGNSEVQKYLLIDEDRSVLDMGYQPNVVPLAVERVLIKRGADEGASGGDSQIELENAQRENRMLRYAELCIRCKREPKCAVYLPCGHRLFCSECATSFRKCPACKELIQNITSASFS